MLIKGKNSAVRIEVPCRSYDMFKRGKNRVVILVDDEMEDTIQQSIDVMGIKDSKGLYTSHLPIIHYYYARPAQKIVSVAEMILNKKRIMRVNPFPDTNRNTLVFDERFSNFKLSEDTKLMLLDTNPKLRPYELDGIDNFGDLKDTFGFKKMQKLVSQLDMYNY